MPTHATSAATYTSLTPSSNVEHNRSSDLNATVELIGVIGVQCRFGGLVAVRATTSG